VSVINAFLATWSSARQTYGEGTPQTGAQYDKSSTLRGLATELESAAPGSRWTGSAATNYDTANTEHRRVIGQLADLDRRLATEVDNSAQSVDTGRRNLDDLRKWVVDAANSVPPGKQGEQMRMVIAQKGLAQLQEIMRQSNAESNEIGGRIQALKGEFEALGNQKFGTKEGAGEELGTGGDEKKDDKKPEEVGAEDSEALQNGQLTPEQHDRLVANTTLTPEQQTALNNGTLTLPPEQMAYLQGYSRAFGDKPPAEIKAIMDRAGADGGRVADVFQLASNPNIKTGLPVSEPPSIGAPASGGKYALPDGIQKVLDGPALTQPFTKGVFEDGRWIVPPEPTGPLQPTQGLNDLANIIQQGNRDLQEGSALDSGLMSKGQEMLAQSNQLPIPQAEGPGFGPLDDGPRWYHENVDPTLQNMFNAVNTDSTVIHEAVTGHGGRDFLDNLTRHQWQDDGLAAGGLFEWVGETAANDPTGRAADTAHALAEYTSSDKDLLNLPGTGGQSLGQVNPELTRDWSRAFAPYLDDMVGYDLGDSSGHFTPLNGADEQPLKLRSLMSVMYSDHIASEIMFSQAGANIEKYIGAAATSITDSGPTSDNSAMRAAGKLQSALDLGSFDESYDRLHDAQKAVQDSYTRRSDLYNIASGVVLDNPVTAPAQVLSTYMKDVIIGPPPPNDAVTPMASPRNDFPVQVKLAEALLNHEVGNPHLRSWLQEQLGGMEHFKVPSSTENQQGYNEFYNNITSYFSEISGADKLMDTYWETYSSAYLNAPPNAGGGS
jgi:hypothetical protein